MEKLDEYQLTANQFCSKSFHGEGLSVNSLLDQLGDASIECQRLDKYKRHLYYDDRSKYDMKQGGPGLSLPAKSDQDIFHAIIGIASETGELLASAIKSLDRYVRDPNAATVDWDFTNLKEEGGDNLWYNALLARGIGVPMSEIADSNIRKLSSRYGGKDYSRDKALNRDLDAEKAAVES